MYLVFTVAFIWNIYFFKRFFRILSFLKFIVLIIILKLVIVEFEMFERYIEIWSWGISQVELSKEREFVWKDRVFRSL